MKAALTTALAACPAAGVERRVCRREARTDARTARGACKDARATCRSCCAAVARGRCPSECAATSGSIGPRGGSLAFCGARIEMLPGALAERTTVRIERLADVSGLTLPADWAVAGPAYRFTPADVALGNFVRITLPHDRPGRVVAPYVVVDGQVLFVEPCSIDAATVVFDGFGLGTFVVLHETVAYPPQVSGLGGGTASARLGDETVDFDLDDAPSFAVHVLDGESVAIEISGMRILEPLRSLRLAIVWSPGTATASVVTASLAVFEGASLTLWTSAPGAGSVALTPTGEFAFEGVASVPVATSSGAEATLDVVFAIVTERWRWPFELACASGFE